MFFHAETALPERNAAFLSAAAGPPVSLVNLAACRRAAHAVKYQKGRAVFPSFLYAVCPHEMFHVEPMRGMRRRVRARRAGADVLYGAAVVMDRTGSTLYNKGTKGNKFPKMERKRTSGNSSFFLLFTPLDSSMIEPVGIRGDDEADEERGKQMPKYIGNKFLQNGTPPFYGRMPLL